MKPAKPEQPTAREHWSQAPASTRKNIEYLLANARRHGGRASLAFVRGCMARGYDCTLAEIPTPITDEIDSVATGKAKQAVIQGYGSIDAAAERQAVAIWNGMSKTRWRTTSIAQEQAERKANAEAERRAEAVKVRAAEILEQRRRSEEQSALEQAEKEIA